MLLRRRRRDPGAYDAAVTSQLLPSKRRLAVSVGTRTSRWLLGRGYLQGRHVMVVEFPKSGGTWLARLIGTALEWPFLDDWGLPPGNNCVMRGHAMPRPGASDQVYMVRDPRDVFVSLFHHRVKHWEENVRYRRAWLGRHSAPLALGSIRRQLPDFLAFEDDFAGQGGSAVPGTWSEHVNAWSKLPCSSGVATSYETLRAQPGAELRRVLTELTGNDPGRAIAEAAVAAHDFDLRQQSQVSTASRSFLRNGVAGGWREVFTVRAGETLQVRHGPAMLRLGYVQSGGWWHDLLAD